MSLLKGVQRQSDEKRRIKARQAIYHHLAKKGGEVFGPIPDGVRREFFCLDKHTWVWHEEWRDQKGHHAITTCYDVRPAGILKSQGSRNYQRLTPAEERNFRQAADLYYQMASTELQRLAHV